jgi:hypothetical protein
MWLASPLTQLVAVSVGAAVGVAEGVGAGVAVDVGVGVGAGAVDVGVGVGVVGPPPPPPVGSTDTGLTGTWQPDAIAVKKQKTANERTTLSLFTNATPP